MPNLLQRAMAAASIFTRGLAASAGFAGTAFAGAAKDRGAMINWRPRLQSADGEYLKERADIVARARDLARNDTAVASAQRRRVSSAVGSGWRLSARVDGEALGFTPEDTVALNRDIERAWAGYAYGHRFEIDAQRQLTFGGLLRTVARSWFVDGEAFVHVGWAPRDVCSTWATRFEIVDSDRIGNKDNGADTDLMRGGVELDPDTRAPIAYWVRERHPQDVGLVAAQPEWRRIPRWTPWGRPQFLHCYDRERAGQTRGVSQLVAALKTLKSLDKFGEATLENAILNALMLGAVKSMAGLRRFRNRSPSRI